MNALTHILLSAVLMGVGATLTFDLWGQCLKWLFKIPPSNICLVGRWLGYMSAGAFRHVNIGSAAPKRSECALGWFAHYLIGCLFAGAFVALVGRGWLQQPTPMPAIGFGLITVLAPFFIMQPLMGLGLAAAKSPQPNQARFRTVMNHAAFGVGLYLFAWLANWLIGGYA
ncbi:MAG: DUF2938 domain-containing protein [Anaerolineales bacterium]|nr:DUF2938 domain-containing protein [Anaerolineales bacterium]